MIRYLLCTLLSITTCNNAACMNSERELTQEECDAEINAAIKEASKGHPKIQQPRKPLLSKPHAIQPPHTPNLGDILKRKNLDQPSINQQYPEQQYIPFTMTEKGKYYIGEEREDVRLESGLPRMVPVIASSLVTPPSTSAQCPTDAELNATEL